MKHTLILPDGSVISSGAQGTAIRGIRVERGVNPDAWLSPGGVTAARLEMELFDPEGIALAAGDTVTVEAVGAFTLDAPQRRGKILTLTGCDCLGKLDKDLTAWLAGLDGWPYTLQSFASMVCTACGLTLEEGDIPNGGYLVQPFRGSAVTGRQLMKWAAEAACRFLIATGERTVAFRWYRDSGIALEKSGERFYYQGSLTQEEALPAPDAVVLRRSESDLGVASGEGENPLYITGNYLLTDADETVAAAILAQLSGLSYTPLTVETPVALNPGDIFTVGGKKALAMAVDTAGHRRKVTSVGAPTAESRVRSQYQALAGRTLELELSLDGVSAELSQVRGTAENAAALSLDVEALEARVTRAEEQGSDLVSQSAVLTQRADSLELTVLESRAALDAKADAETVTEIAEHFRFDEEGLTISNSATGMGIGVSEERVVFTGGSDPTTEILPSAMRTTNLRVGSRLDIGNFALLPRTNGNLSLRYVGN